MVGRGLPFGLKVKIGLRAHYQITVIELKYMKPTVVVLHVLAVMVFAGGAHGVDLRLVLAVHHQFRTLAMVTIGLIVNNGLQVSSGFLFLLHRKACTQLGNGIPVMILMATGMRMCSVMTMCMSGMFHRNLRQHLLRSRLQRRSPEYWPSA
ncbi:hypothetical protein SE18_25640 [Herpetosiphon geysericola]|uniref:Uncharacterized protein n=1 Tax=Herpetosiphon geysericola TaxID=70996 RepID=A0A0P6YD91_9CHLR|nr:hypothetical protein SE18_25640 [Herpetosiphon geysericola]